VNEKFEYVRKWSWRI